LAKGFISGSHWAFRREMVLECELSFLVICFKS
jgi:hypothetical protein